MYIPRKIFSFVILIIAFMGSISYAQRVPRRAAQMQQASDPDASLPDFFKGNDLSQVTADQVTDSQVIAIQSQMQARGITADQLEQVVLAKGLPTAEWQKIKVRLSSTGGKQGVGSSETTSPAADRIAVANDYKAYQKTPTSNVFGAEFFNSPSLSFEPNLRIATPVNYILGPDDELLLNVSGYQEVNIRAAVQPEGAITIPQVGSVMVSGLTIEQATARIRDKMAQTAYASLRNGLSRLIVSLNKIKSIHVTIVGAAKPGNYTVSSLSTVFNSLYQCGGPGDINTYRNIELIRNNQVIQKIDLYQFLTRGDQRGNVPLKENDVINFPVYQKRVTISGEVKRPGIYELKNGETLENLLFFAGGYTEKAYKATIKAMQITDTEKKVKDITKAETATYQPANGDEFQVDTVLNRFVNSVLVKGAVYRPGMFELTPGFTLSSLIKRAGGLREEAFTDRGVINRSYPDGTKENVTFNVRDILNGTVPDIKLIKQDVVTIAAITDFKTEYKITVQGEVRKPGQFSYENNLSLKDALFNAGGFTDAAASYNIEVGRRIIANNAEKAPDSIATIFRISTERGLAIENNKFILEPYDVVTVRRNPAYILQQIVTINGEVNFPGTYTIQSKREHVSDLLKRAGGLTSLAYERGVFLIRSTPPVDTIKQQNVKNLQNTIRDTSSKVINDVTHANNRIAVDMSVITEKPGSDKDYILQDGDVIEVLKTNPLVKISGEVFSATQTGYVSGKSVRYYLSQAGGTTENARRSKIYVIYANGQIRKTHNGIAGVFRSYPTVETGAEVVVPRKVEKKELSTTERIGILSAIVSLASLIIITITNIK